MVEKVDLLKYLKKPNNSCKVTADEEYIYIKMVPSCESPYLDLKGLGKDVEILACVHPVNSEAYLVLSSSLSDSGEFMYIPSCLDVIVPSEKPFVWSKGEPNTTIRIKRIGIIHEMSKTPVQEPKEGGGDGKNQVEIPELSTGTLVIAGLIGLVAGIAVARWVR